MDTKRNKKVAENEKEARKKFHYLNTEVPAYYGHRLIWISRYCRQEAPNQLDRLAIDNPA